MISNNINAKIFKYRIYIVLIGFNNEKKIALVGLVVLIIGIAMAVGGYYEATSILSHNLHTAVKSDPSSKTEYITNNMTMSS